MCGICGIVSLDTIPHGLVRTMNDTLRRRGPDDEGFYEGPSVALGMRRLSIIDIDGSRQPIWSDDQRYVAVFNGEIYNFRELRAELARQGCDFRTQGDGEVVVNLFARHGVRSFRRLRGMFAVAIWDTLKRTLWLARDPLGIKPLFYSQIGSELVFGSEIKAILASGRVARRVDHQALDAFFAYTYIPAPYTIYQAVRKLEPATCLEWQGGKVRYHRYWHLPDEIDRPGPSIEELGELIEDSVRAHMVSDVPVGAFLSGGVDSSAIVSRMQAGRAERVKAFTVRFAGVSSHLFDETPYARQLQSRYGFDLVEQEVRLGFLDSLQDGIRAFDEPFADDSIMPTFEICRLAAQQLKVCLAGAGGDELFGGYNRYQGLALHDRIRRMLPPPISAFASRGLALSSAIMGRHTRRGDLIQRFANGLGLPSDDAYLQFVTSLPWEERKKLHTADARTEVDPDETRDLVNRHLRAVDGPDRVRAAMYADTQTYLPEDVLALSDRIGMWHSLEIRVPLADRELMEAAFSMPSSAHVTARQKKLSLKRAVAGWLPESILSHPKQGFESPTAAWLRGNAQTKFREVLDNGEAMLSQFIDLETVDSLLTGHAKGHADQAKSLFSVLAFATWLETDTC